MGFGLIIIGDEILSHLDPVRQVAYQIELGVKAPV